MRGSTREGGDVEARGEGVGKKDALKGDFGKGEGNALVRQGG